MKPIVSALLGDISLSFKGLEDGIDGPIIPRLESRRPAFMVNVLGCIGGFSIQKSWP
jgi:hypothetical protein